MDVTVCKLPKYKAGIVSGCIRAQTEWSRDSFRITLLGEDGTVWVGKASSADLLATSQALSMEFEDYIKETRTALTTQGGSTEFMYVIEDDKFMWKKVVDIDNQITNKFGSVSIDAVPSTEMIEHIMDTLIDLNFCLQTRVSSLEKENWNLETGNEHLKTKLTAYKDQKKAMEETLYSKFLEILNAKKLRIALLEEKIDDLQNCPSTSGTILSNVSSVKQTLKKVLPTKKKPVYTKKRVDDSVEDMSDTPPKSYEKNKMPPKRKATLVQIVSSTNNDEFVAQGSSTSCKTGSANHYDSETDCDSSSGEENATSSKMSRKICIDEIRNVDGSVKVYASVNTLQKSTHHIESNVNETCETASISTLSVINKDSEYSRETTREMNTQQFLDELGM